MAEISKLSVGQALDKLRADTPETKVARLGAKMGELDDEIQRLRAASRRLERDQAANSMGDAPKVNVKPVARPKNLGVISWTVILAILIVAVATVVYAVR